jgi:hypothetical protein
MISNRKLFYSVFLQRGAYPLFYKAGKQSGYGYPLFFKAGMLHAAKTRFQKNKLFSFYQTPKKY